MPTAKSARAVLGLVLVSTIAAACGSSGTGGPVGATTASGNSSPIALSRCMRANGLSNFPDPTMGSGGEGFPGGIIQSIGGGLTADGITFNGPALSRAERACSRYLTPKGPPPQLSASRRRELLAFAACMRSHGVPNFPDPPLSGGGGPHVTNGAPPSLLGLAAQAAVRACGHGAGHFQIVAP
jgi:hypothetical protein